MTTTYTSINWTKLAAWQVEEAVTFEKRSPTWRLFIEGALNVIANHSRKVAVRDEALELLMMMRKRHARTNISLPTDKPLPRGMTFDWMDYNKSYVAGTPSRVMTIINLAQPKPIPPSHESLRAQLEKITREAFLGKPSDV